LSKKEITLRVLDTTVSTENAPLKNFTKTQNSDFSLQIQIRQNFKEFFYYEIPEILFCFAG